MGGRREHRARARGLSDAVRVSDPARRRARAWRHTRRARGRRAVESRSGQCDRVCAGALARDAARHGRAAPARLHVRHEELRDRATRAPAVQERPAGGQRRLWLATHRARARNGAGRGDGSRRYRRAPRDLYVPPIGHRGALRLRGRGLKPAREARVWPGRHGGRSHGVARVLRAGQRRWAQFRTRDPARARAYLERARVHVSRRRPVGGRAGQRLPRRRLHACVAACAVSLEQHPRRRAARSRARGSASRFKGARSASAAHARRSARGSARRQLRRAVAAIAQHRGQDARPARVPRLG